MLERSPSNERNATPGAPARFYLDGINKAVTARIAHQDDAGMTLRQELPFLQLHRTLRDSSGRVGSLMDVGLTVRDGTPHLVLEVRYDNDEDNTVELDTKLAHHIIDTAEGHLDLDDDDDEPTTQFRTHRRRDDQTVPYVLSQAGESTEIIIAGAPTTPLVPYARHPKAAWYSEIWQTFARLFRSN